MKSADNGAAEERAFARGAGRVFQAAGLVLWLVAIGVLGISALVCEPSGEIASRWVDHLYGETLPAAVLAIGAWSGIVGGLALATTGLGLQAERSDAAVFGMIVAVLLAAIYWAATVLLITQAGPWLSALPAAVVGLAMSFLAVLARRSLLVLRRFPPPPDRNIVTDEVLEQWRAEREKRRENHT